MEIGLGEILFVIFIILILFGPGRITKTAGELGKGIKAFRDGLAGKDEEENTEEIVPKKKNKRN
jgi:sec-independent protein translocase protein TatA